jgi:hypothetical protein
VVVVLELVDNITPLTPLDIPHKRGSALNGNNTPEALLHGVIVTLPEVGVWGGEVASKADKTV